jgi:hypothetical protein
MRAYFYKGPTKDGEVLWLLNVIKDDQHLYDKRKYATKTARKIKKQFRSVVITYCWTKEAFIGRHYLTFKFTDESDEAYFILWSSNGVEI